MKRQVAEIARMDRTTYAKRALATSLFVMCALCWLANATPLIDGNLRKQSTLSFVYVSSLLP